MKAYPRANEKRRSIHDPEVRPRRIAFLKEAFFNFLILQILFLGLFAYIFGALYQSNGHVHNLDFLFVDYDGGPIGAAVRQAYTKLHGDTFPTLHERLATDYPISSLREEVCSVRYWAALYVESGASSRLDGALRGGDAAATYNGAEAVSMIWNQARYATVADAAIRNNLQNLSSTAALLYSTANGTSVIRITNTDDERAVAVFSNPWSLAQINIQPTSQGARLIYNTLVIILILIQEFFYLGTINGLYARFKLFGTIRPRRIIIYRNIISVAYTCAGALCVSGMIWAFRSDWQVNANQYALTWLILWLFAHLNFLTLDIFTVWLPAPYVPMALISWVVFNVTSILLPFQMSPGFYRWGYAIPAHNVFQTLIDIWSGGCNPRLHISLPVLFVWEVVGIFGSAVGVYRRCHYAVLAEKQQEASFESRVRAALAFERKRDAEKREEASQLDGMDSTQIKTSTNESAEEQREESELADAIRSENEQLDEQTPRYAEAPRFMFALPFGSNDRGTPSRLKRQKTAP